MIKLKGDLRLNFVREVAWVEESGTGQLTIHLTNGEQLKFTDVENWEFIEDRRPIQS
jgi:hypothetical protein